jgi:hypothetical protein
MWDLKGGKWPSLGTVNPYGFLRPFSVYGNNGTLEAESSVATSGDFYVALDSAGNTYVSTGFPDSSLEKHVPDGSLGWAVPRPTFQGDQIKVVESGPQAGVYVAGSSAHSQLWLPNPYMGKGYLARYSLDGNLIWSDETTQIDSRTSGPTSIAFDVLADGTVLFVANHETIGNDESFGFYLGIAGPSGIIGSDTKVCDAGPTSTGCGSVGLARIAPDGSAFYVAKTFVDPLTGLSGPCQVFRYGPDLVEDATYQPTPCPGLSTVDAAGSTYVADWTSSTSIYSSPGDQGAGWELRKYDATGQLIWTTHPTWPNSANYELRKLIVSGGRIYASEGLAYQLHDGTTANLVGVWDANTGALLDQEPIGAGMIFGSHIEDFAVNGSGQVVVSGDELDPSGTHWDYYRNYYQWTQP